MCITLEYMYFFLSVYVLYSISEKKTRLEQNVVHIYKQKINAPKKIGKIK